MSNYLNQHDNSYDLLSNIDSLDFQKKSVLILGAGWMGRQHATALFEMNIKDVTIVSRSKEKVIELCDEFGYSPIYGNTNEILQKIQEKDLTIISTPIESLIPMTKIAIECGQKNILVEKPGSIYHNELLNLNKSINNVRIRVAYNRLTYPNLHKLKTLISEEGGISSIRFTFTERLDGINFSSHTPEILRHWGICNSSHVISMVFDLIGFPKEFQFNQTGKLDWHPTGSIFVGSGLTEKNIPFSYHADWGSSGRWGIEVMTKENAYKLVSLEELFVCHKNSFEWERIEFNVAYPKVKHGVSEEIAIMLYEDLEDKIQLVTLEKAAKFNQVAEKILGYDSK